MTRLRTSKILNPVRAWALAGAKGLIRAYQLAVSPCLGHHCRFHPTCSHYALAVLDRHGLGRGAWFALRRLLRCHPFHPGGVDLPPPTKVEPS